MSKILKDTLKIFLIGFLVLGIFCVDLFGTNSLKASSETEKIRAELEAKLNQIQKQIVQYQNQIQENRKKAKTLKNEISLLENQIKKAELEIQETELAIRETELNIQQIEEKMKSLEEQILQQKKVLAEYIRVVNWYDDDTLLEIILKKETFSEFFDEINQLEVIQANLQESLDRIKASRADWQKKKEELEEQRNEQYQLKALQEIQRFSIKKKQRAKERLLQKTKGQEKLYQQLIKKAHQDIEFIKNQIYLLENIGVSMTFEQAVNHALFACAKTGLRPAFLLAVLKIESKLGAYLGTGNWKKDMYDCYRKLGKFTKAEREKAAFFKITQELGLNPDLQPVSAEPRYGCGGAMGAAQFMPTTWLAYKEKIAKLTGHNPPNPWNIDDAFTAAAIKLAEAGASQRTYEKEWAAAAKYIAGRRWKTSRTARSYANRVMELADYFQEQLDLIKGK